MIVKKHSILYFLISAMFFMAFALSIVLEGDIHSYSSLGINYIGLAMLIFGIVLSRKNIIKIREGLSPLVSIGFCLIYLVLLSTTRETSIYENVGLYKTLISGIIFYYLVLINSDTSVKKFIRYLLMVIYVQIAIGIMQYYFSYFTFNNKILGTFSGPNLLGNTLSIIILILSIEIYHIKSQSNRLQYTLIVPMILALILLIMSGIRTSVISCMVGLILVLTSSKKQRPLIFSFIIFGVLFLFTGNVKDNIFINISDIAPIARIQIGINDLFQILQDGSIYMANNTLSISYHLFGYMENIYDYLFGKGLLFTGGYGVVKSGSSFAYLANDTGNLTDATLVALFVEYGAIGIFLIIAPFMLIFKKYYDDGLRKYVLPLASVLILQSITDLGIFLVINNVIIFFYLENVLKSRYSNQSTSTQSLKSYEM